MRYFIIHIDNYSFLRLLLFSVLIIWPSCVVFWVSCAVFGCPNAAGKSNLEYVVWDYRYGIQKDCKERQNHSQEGLIPVKWCAIFVTEFEKISIGLKIIVKWSKKIHRKTLFLNRETEYLLQGLIFWVRGLIFSVQDSILFVLRYRSLLNGRKIPVYK